MARPNLTLATANLIRTEAYTTLNHHARTQRSALQPARERGVVVPTVASVETVEVSDRIRDPSHSTTQISDSINNNSNLITDFEFSINDYPILNYRLSIVNTWEDARRQRAIERGYEYVAPTVALNATVASSAQNDTDCLRTDGELARICGLGFKHYTRYERWLILHNMSRAGGQGFTFDELSTRCGMLGCKGSATHLRRIIRKGIGFYWEYDPRTDTIYPTGYVELCKRAIQYAHDLGLHDLYLYGNHPGQRRDMYISVSGNAGDFEAQILASWYGLHGCPTISRYSLSAITGRDARSIRRMERRACIHITYNEAQTTDPAAVPLNADGSLRGDVRYENGVWSSRMPNTYTPRMTRQHHRRGQGRKAACWFKHWLSSDRLPGRPQAKVSDNFRDLGKLNCIWRTYCETDKALTASLKRGVLTTLYVATGRQHRGRVWKVAKNEDMYD